MFFIFSKDYKLLKLSKRENYLIGNIVKIKRRNMNTKKTLISLVIIIFLLSMQNASAVGGTTDTYNPNISVKVKYLAWDSAWSGKNMSININLSKMGISNIKNIVYVENYYSVDSYNMPKLFAGTRYETAKIDNNLSFFILRPSAGTAGKRYSLIESIIVINGKRVSITWYDYTGKRINPIPKVGRTIKPATSMTKNTVKNNTNISRPKTNVTSSPTKVLTVNVSKMTKDTNVSEKDSVTLRSDDTENGKERGFFMSTLRNILNKLYTVSSALSTNF